ncbi:hypothetical protein [Haloferula sp.]|uniref:hypothetical protein n=1 Tax=Haloferula sp. TaxID=2497595 RepID=UPI003C74897E
MKPRFQQNPSDLKKRRPEQNPGTDSYSDDQLVHRHAFGRPVFGLPVLLASMAFAFLLTPGALASNRWELTGTLNYVNPLLAGTFSSGQSFSISMDLDDAAPLTFSERLDFFTSIGTFSNTVSNGNVSFPNYAADFRSTASSGGVQVRNNETNAGFGYDQLSLSFGSFFPGTVTAPEAQGFELRSIEFNFTDESSPSDMITGSGATFPTIDVPFIGPDTFNLARSTNSTFHFVLRFSGGTPEGSNFIRGSITTSSFSTGGGGFDAWPDLTDLPEALRGPDATPAGDGVANLIKYAIGIGPLESAAERIPQEVAQISVADETYPLVCFTRDTSAIGISARIEVAASLDFATDLGVTVISTEDLGNGLERICVRSNVPYSDQLRQFFRLKVSEE